MADTQLNHSFKIQVIFNSEKPVPLALDMEYSMLVVKKKTIMKSFSTSNVPVHQLPEG